MAQASFQLNMEHGGGSHLGLKHGTRARSSSAFQSMPARVQTPEDLVIKFFDADDEQGIFCLLCLPCGAVSRPEFRRLCH